MVRIYHKIYIDCFVFAMIISSSQIVLIYSYSATIRSPAFEQWQVRSNELPMKGTVLSTERFPNQNKAQHSADTYDERIIGVSKCLLDVFCDSASKMQLSSLSYPLYLIYSIGGCMCSTDPSSFNWSRGNICTFPIVVFFLIAYSVSYISPKSWVLFPLLMYKFMMHTDYCVHYGYGLPFVFVCFHITLIISLPLFMPTYLKELNIWNTCQVYYVPGV